MGSGWRCEGQTVDCRPAEPIDCNKGGCGWETWGASSQTGLLTHTDTAAGGQNHVRDSNNISYMYRINFQLRVLNDVNTHWSILFFFDLKDYISYCKDVYRYFWFKFSELFVAGLKYCLFLSMALRHWSLYCFNITRLGGVRSTQCLFAFDSVLLGWSFYRFSKEMSLKSASPSIFCIQ